MLQYDNNSFIVRFSYIRTVVITYIYIYIYIYIPYDTSYVTYDRVQLQRCFTDSFNIIKHPRYLHFCPAAILAYYMSIDTNSSMELTN